MLIFLSKKVGKMLKNVDKAEKVKLVFLEIVKFKLIFQKSLRNFDRKKVVKT
jgi:hypothetical protein